MNITAEFSIQKYDALCFSFQDKGLDPQTEIQKSLREHLQNMYEKNVHKEARRYIDRVIADNSEQKPPAEQIELAADASRRGRSRPKPSDDSVQLGL